MQTTTLDLCAGIPVADYANGERKTTYRDPDGNEIGCGGAPLSPASGPGDTTARSPA